MHPWKVVLGSWRRHRVRLCGTTPFGIRRSQVAPVQIPGESKKFLVPIGGSPPPPRRCGPSSTRRWIRSGSGGPRERWPPSKIVLSPSASHCRSGEFHGTSFDSGEGLPGSRQSCSHGELARPGNLARPDRARTIASTASNRSNARKHGPSVR